MASLKNIGPNPNPEKQQTPQQQQHILQHQSDKKSSDLTSTPSHKNRPTSRKISSSDDKQNKNSSSTSSSSKNQITAQINKSFGRPRIGSDNFIERRGPPLFPLKQMSQPEPLSINPDELSSENGSHSASSDDFKNNPLNQFTPTSALSPTNSVLSPNKTPSPNSQSKMRRSRTSQSESGTSMTFASGDSFYKNPAFTPIFGSSPNRLKLKPKINKRFRHKSDRTDAAHVSIKNDLL